LFHNKTTLIFYYIFAIDACAVKLW